MILAVALNAALDVTYRVDGKVRPHSAHRVRAVEAAAGGKALNVARVLHTLGTPVLSTGLLGGRTGVEIAERIPAGLRHSFAAVAGESRRAVVVADDADATGFWEPGPQVTAEEWESFWRRYVALLRVSTVAVLSGSLPCGLPDDTYARMTAEARRAGVAVIVDCDGPALRAALSARPDVVKPNAAELAAAVPDVDVSTDAGATAAARRLREAGA
ncbi:MAG: 1-phosphofructokinase family hexose kinase, partial [Stackebrandtia sp.]